jgi:hypothetical protein
MCDKKSLLRGVERTMSLTGFLKQSGEVRAVLRQAFPLPRRQDPFPALQAQPLTTNYALVGQAFDYLLRFYMQRYNPHAPERTHWVADWIDSDLEVVGTGEEAPLQNQERVARPFLARAHENHEIYLQTGEVTDDLLRSCLDLASIDSLVRIGELRGSLGHADARDLRDLRNLFALIPQHPFLDGDPCILNPIFRFPSGADGDLLIGTTLIEIKTTKFSGIKQEYYHQLLGYYLLNLANQNHAYDIKQIGIYFSRHGYLWKLPLETPGDEKTFERFLPVWNGHVQRYHHMLEKP